MTKDVQFCSYGPCHGDLDNMTKDELGCSDCVGLHPELEDN